MKNTFPTISFLGIFFLPSLIMTSLGASSMAAGLMLIVVIIFAKLLLNPKRSFAFNLKKRLVFELLIFGVPSFIFLHGLISYYYISAFNFQRFFQSYLFFFLMIITSWGFSRFIFLLKNNELVFILKIVLWGFILNSLIGLTGLQLFSQTTHKPVGLFAEPSHLAITIAPILTFFSIIKLPKLYIYLTFFAVWAIIINNFTTLVVILFCFGLSFQNIRDLKYIMLTALVSIILSIYTNLGYFLSRVNINSESDNLSVLVILQGWDIAKNILLSISISGVGFQQFGIINVDSEVLDRVTLLANRELNILDGGTTASKIVGEFGIWGIILITLVIFLCLTIFKRIYASNSAEFDIRQAFFYSSILAFSFELFVRGVGYFSPSVFLFLVGVFGISANYPLATFDISMQQKLN